MSQVHSRDALPEQPHHFHVPPPKDAATVVGVRVLKAAPPTPAGGGIVPEVHVSSDEVKMHTVIHDAKQNEEKAVHNAYKNVVKNLDKPSLFICPNEEEQGDMLADMVFYTLMREERVHKGVIPPDVPREKDAFRALFFEKKCQMKTNGKEILEAMAPSSGERLKERLAAEIDKKTIIFRDRFNGEQSIPRNFKRDYEALAHLLGKIETLAAEENPKSCAQNNREILRLMREAQKNPAYQLMKHDESEPTVRLLHRLALASYTEAHVMDAFHEVAKPLQPEKKLSLVKRLRQARDTGYENGAIKNDHSLRYIASYFKQTVGAFFSTKLGGKVATFFGTPYDPRMLGNNTGALYDETMKFGENKVSVRTVYTPSPTVGDEVSPEARLILQAMENRAMMTPQQLERDPYPYTRWNYTNFQNIASKDENGRAVAIMRLNEEFPLSFHGITLTVDSPHYRAGVHGNNDKKIQEATKDDNPLDEDYCEKQINELCDDANFTLDNRVGNPGGRYYFPVPQGERAAWKTKMREIANEAFLIASAMENIEETGLANVEWNWCQKAAFRELVLLGVLKFQQERTASEVAGTGGKVLATNACKENIDRGGKANACMLWALGDKEHDEDVFAASQARALFGRGRLVLPDRMEPMFALMTVIPRQEVKAFLNGIGGATVELAPEEQKPQEE